MAPKYQSNHDSQGGNTELINMWGMTSADNPQIKITFSLKKKYNAQNSSSAVECQQIILY
jgi:hypothetical protein